MTTKRKRFHFIYSFKYIKYALLLCLVPMIQALLAWDWDSLLGAIRQDIVILLAAAGVVFCLWCVTSFWFEAGRLYVRHGIITRRHDVFVPGSITALVIERPLHCRVLGASKVTLYFRANLYPRSFTLYLSKKDGAAAAQALLPCEQGASVFRPAGTDRLAFIMLSANALTSAAFAVLCVKNISELLGQNWQDFALEHFMTLENVAARVLPAGAAFVATLLFLIITFTLGHSFVRCVGFKVRRAGDVLLVQGGLITKVERRIAVADITVCDVHVTPVARLLRRYPVYLTAGSYNGTDAPVLAYKPGQEHLAAELLPRFTMPGIPYCNPTHKSLGQYLWLPAAVFCLTAVLYCAAIPRMPDILPVLFVPLLLSLYAILTAVRGYRSEGMGRNFNGTLNICYARTFTLHYLCVLTTDVTLCLKASPIAKDEGRCNAYACTPCHTFRTRGIDVAEVNKLIF